MVMTPEDPMREAQAPGADPELERRLELLLDEMVASSPELPPDFAERTMSLRPSAPWEVRHASFWRIPALAGAGLLAASATVFVAPLGNFAPATALVVWGNLITSALASPLSVLFAAGPALAEAGAALQGSVTPAAGLFLLGSGALFGAATLASLRWRTSRAPR
jgi:hypothetical protein